MIKYNVIFWNEYCKRFKFVVSYINKYGKTDMESDLTVEPIGDTDNYTFTKKDKESIYRCFDYDVRIHFIPKWVGKCISNINGFLLR